MGHLEHVEAELGLEVRRVIVGIRHPVAELLAQLRIELGDHAVGPLGVAGRVGDVVAEGPEREGVLVGGLRRLEQGEDEIAAPDVVQEIREELAAERKIAEVRDVRAAVRKSAGARQIGAGRGESPANLRDHDGVPAAVDHRLMREDREGADG